MLDAGGTVVMGMSPLSRAGSGGKQGLVYFTGCDVAGNGRGRYCKLCVVFGPS